jgi:hypothetical protein
VLRTKHCRASRPAALIRRLPVKRTVPNWRRDQPAVRFLASGLRLLQSAGHPAAACGLSGGTRRALACGHAHAWLFEWHLLLPVMALDETTSNHAVYKSLTALADQSHVHVLMCSQTQVQQAWVPTSSAVPLRCAHHH